MLSQILICIGIKGLVMSNMVKASGFWNSWLNLWISMILVLNNIEIKLNRILLWLFVVTSILNLVQGWLGSCMIKRLTFIINYLLREAKTAREAIHRHMLKSKVSINLKIYKLKQTLKVYVNSKGYKKILKLIEINSEKF